MRFWPMSNDSNSDLQSHLLDRRRSRRLFVQIRVRVEWRLENKAPIYEETGTSMVSAHGALISFNSVPPFGQNVILQNVSTNETQEAIVVFVSKTAARGGQFNVGIEFTKPNA